MGLLLGRGERRRLPHLKRGRRDEAAAPVARRTILLQATMVSSNACGG